MAAASKYRGGLAGGALGQAVQSLLFHSRGVRMNPTDDMLHAAVCTFLAPSAPPLPPARSGGARSSGRPHPLSGLTWCLMCCPHNSRYLRCSMCYDPLVIIPGRPASVACKPLLLVLMFVVLVTALLLPGLRRVATGGNFAGSPSLDANFIVWWTLLLSVIGKARLYMGVDPTLTTLVRLRQLTDKLLSEPVDVRDTGSVSRWSTHITFVLGLVKQQVGVKHGSVLVGYTAACICTSTVLTVWVLLHSNLTRGGAEALGADTGLWVLGLLALTQFIMLLQMVWPLLAADAAIASSIAAVRNQALAPRLLHDMTAFIHVVEERATVVRGEHVAEHQPSPSLAHWLRPPPSSSAVELKVGPGVRSRRHAPDSAHAAPLIGHQSESLPASAAGEMQAMTYAAGVAQTWSTHYEGIQLPLFGSSWATLTVSNAYLYGVGTSAALAAGSFLVRVAYASILANGH